MKRQMVTVLFMAMLMASVMGCGASTSGDTTTVDGQMLAEAVTEVDTEEEILETEQTEMEEEEQEEVLFRIRIAGVSELGGINASDMPSSKECYELCLLTDGSEYDVYQVVQSYCEDKIFYRVKIENKFELDHEYILPEYAEDPEKIENQDFWVWDGGAEILDPDIDVTQYIEVW